MVKIDELEKILQEEDNKKSSDSDYQDMKLFLEQAQESGLAIRKEYSITQIDTIGYNYSQQISSKVKS